MRRVTKRIIANVTIFSCILFTIIVLNRPHTGSTTFPWMKIRYQTTTTTLPEARGLCPGISDSSKPALVVARISSDDDKWLDDVALKEKYHLCAYTADVPSDPNTNELQVPKNRGHEAMAYLTFLIDNYASIPEAGAVFVHGSRFAWHNDHGTYDNLALLNALNLTAATEKHGYHNLRCDWSLSTCPANTIPQGSLDTTMQARLEPWDRRAVSDSLLPDALGVLFGGEDWTRGGMPTIGRGLGVKSQCCAQFVVTREQIWQHAREEYIALRQWLLDGMGPNRSKDTAPEDDRVAGRILSYIWHILFMKHELFEGGDGLDLEKLNAGACPNARKCYCRLYGRCELERCTVASCAGEYSLPKDLTLPADWAERHSGL